MGNQLLVSSKGLLTPGKLTHSWCKAQLEMVTDPCGGRAKSCLAMAFKREWSHCVLPTPLNLETVKDLLVQPL